MTLELEILAGFRNNVAKDGGCTLKWRIILDEIKIWKVEVKSGIPGGIVSRPARSGAAAPALKSFELGNQVL